MAKSTKALDLLVTLQGRFEANHARHPGLEWTTVQHRLTGKPDKLTVLRAMEDSGGEPDVVEHDAATGELLFVDCCADSPAGRRSLCYDREARLGRKENRPEGSALEMAAKLGVELLTEAQYRHLQSLGPFDTKTSSWVQTPAAIRKLGGALFCDRRYAHVFLYHNGAESYYAARGFRAAIRV
jgi:hypothetical protein